jgi:serine/threonine protein kinase
MAAAPTSSVDLLELVRKSGLVEKSNLDSWLQGNPDLPEKVDALAARLVKDGVLTRFHAKHMLTGKYRGFIIGQYKVLQQIGVGGMGVIFLAEHMGMKRRVAIKVLPAERVNDPESLERFYREVRVAAALDHPNIVRAYDADNSGDIHFMVMEYIEGESLEQLVRCKRRLPIEDAADYISQAACGLQHAHDRGLIHRDIKPGNLILEKTGDLKILDMGLARLFQDQSTLTVDLGHGAAIGTADYMAPEQAINSHDVDIRADIYSLGVTLYTLLTGQPPFANEPMTQKLLAHQVRQPMPLSIVRPEVPEAMSAAVEKMMAKRPADRYQIPEMIVEALEPWAKPRFIAASPTTRVAGKHRGLPVIVAPGKRKRRGRYAVLAVTAMLLFGASVIALQNRHSNARAAATPSTAPILPSASIEPPAIEPPRPLEPAPGELRHYDTRGEQIERLALSPTDPWFAGGSRQGVVRIWDLETGGILQEMPGHTGVVWFVAFHPHGRLLASSGADATIRIWNVDTGKEVKTIDGPPASQMWSAVFSPDGKQLFSGGDDGVGRIWNVETGELIRTCEKHGKTINWVAWAPDGSLVYSAGWDGTLRGWDASTGMQRFAFTEAKRKINMVAVTHDGRHLLCSNDTGQVHLLDATSGFKVATFLDKTATQWSAAFSRDGLRAVTSGSENNVHLWDVSQGRLIYTFMGHTDKVPSCVMTADGKRIITASWDKTVRIWVTP